MPPKRGKKGKRRGDSSSDDEASAAAAAAVTAAPKQSTANGSEDESTAGAGTSKAKAKAKTKGKKKGKGARNNNDDSDSDDVDALDPLAHLRGGKGKLGRRGGDSDEEDRPKKLLTKKEKRRLEEEQRRREKEAAGAGSSGDDTKGDEEHDDQENEDGGDEAGEEDGKQKKNKSLSKKEQRRLDEQALVEREQREEKTAADEAAAAAAAAAVITAVAAAEAEQAAARGDGGDDEAPESSSAKHNKGKKGKKDKKGKKGRGDDGGDVDAAEDAGDGDGDGDEAALSRGMESLSVSAGGGLEGAPPAAVRLSKKERKRAEAAALAAAAAEEKGSTDDDEEAEEEEEEKEKEKSRLLKEKATVLAAKATAKEVESGDEDDGQKRRMSKKERKKAKTKVGKKGGSSALAEDASVEELPAPPAAASERVAINAVDDEEAASAAPLPPPASAAACVVGATTDMDLQEDAPAPAVAAPAAAPVVAEAAEHKPKKKEKKSKLMKKLEEAARLKAEAEAAAGVSGGGGDDDVASRKAAAEEEEAERARKEEKKARKAKKDAAKEKESKVKSILEDLDDAEYYGSDHEEREKSRAGSGADGSAKETVDEEFARLVAAAEAGGKTATSRQRKKILQDIEARRRAAAEEEREEAAHRDGAQFGCSQTAVPAGDQQWANSLDVTIEAFSISAHDKTLFKDSPLQIVHGRKYGLVGPNGAGKSTLLKMIASGELKIPPRIDCLYVEQEVVADDTPAVIAVMKADKARWSLMEEERRVNRLLRDDPENDKLNERLQQVHEELHTAGGDGAEAQARRILFGLGFDDIMQVKATKHFSGGWRMRISLARALFMAPTLLMLDEPTNHLDLNAVIWLDDYLQKWKKTLLVVSHDQDFLNSVCEEILHLDHQRVNQYKGNYDQFKEMEAQKRKQQAKEWEKQQRRLTALKKGGKSKGKAEETVKKSKFREPGGSKKKKNDAVAAGTGEVVKTELIERPREYVVTLHFPEVSTLSPPVLEVMDVNFKYPTGPTILKNVNFGLDQSSRVCIVGPNGAGKTTLLKLLTGALEPTEGLIRRNPRMRAGIYNQHFVDRLPMDIDPTSYLRSKFSDQCDYQQARNLLGRFGLEGHAHTIKMRDLSGGQKARVVFCELSLQAPHVLFLDEPTNNLDIESIDALCTAVTEFNGGVVVVTHDARLIEATDCRLWIVDEQEVTEWQGEFDEYRADLLQKLEDKLAAQEQARADKLAA